LFALPSSLWAQILHELIYERLDKRKLAGLSAMTGCWLALKVQPEIASYCRNSLPDLWKTQVSELEQRERDLQVDKHRRKQRNSLNELISSSRIYISLAPVATDKWSTTCILCEWGLYSVRPTNPPRKRHTGKVYSNGLNKLTIGYWIGLIKDGS
jgi:hypothetical protein